MATEDGVVGLVLAAGAGRRMGGPKALVRGPDGTPWVVRAVRALAEGGCEPVLVVVGAGAAAVAAVLQGEPVEVVEAPGWAEGMGASLRTGLTELTSRPAAAVLVAPVDVPSLSADVVRRVAAMAGPDALARAVYDGRPGHPVLIGREHWGGVLARAAGEDGARPYLRDHPPDPIECADLGSGADVDTVDRLPAGHRPWQHPPAG